MAIVPFDCEFIEGEPIALAAICDCCRPLLSHHEYMTLYLEREYACRIHIKKIAQWYDQNYLIRQVLLNDEAQRTYIISQIKIYLTQFDPDTQARFIQSALPFGAILSMLNIEPNFANRQFLKRTTPLFSGTYQSAVRCCPNYFGRYHQILDHHQHVLADVCEWVA